MCVYIENGKEEMSSFMICQCSAESEGEEEEGGDDNNIQLKKQFLS